MTRADPNRLNDFNMGTNGNGDDVPPAGGALKTEMAKINKNLMKVLQINQQVKAVTLRCETCGGPHSFNDCLATVGQTQNEDLKGTTTQSRIAYKGSTIPITSSPPKVVERKTEVRNDTVPPTNNGSTKDVQPSVVQVETQIPNSEPVVAPVVEPVEAPVSALKPNPKPSIPYPSRLHDQKLHEKANDQMEKFFEIFQDLNFNISFADALILIPKFSSTIKNRSISCPVRVAKDVFVKVGKFHFPTDFVVIDFDADPRLPLILGRSFLKTERALIDVYEGELTLRVSNKAVTFNLDQTSRYSANYDAELINRIDVIDVACEEYSQKVLGFSLSGNPTPRTEPIVLTSFPTLTPFGDSDFLLEETDAFLATEDEPISSEINYSFYDSKGDILLLEEFLMMIHHHHLSLYKNLKLLNQKIKNLLLMNHP
nr:reverse transcriptase domain-containing protein [Tanacetum cinerariifolium]